MTNKTNERFTEATNNTVDTAYNFLQTSLESIEKLTKIQLESSRKILDETSQSIKDMAGVSNSKDLFDKVNQLATTTVEHNICNCRDAYDVLSNAQSQISKMFETYFQNAQQNMSSVVENFSQFNPTSKGNFASDSLKSWINGTNQAINTLTKMSSQVTEFAKNNVKAATTATANTVKAATSARKG